MIVEALARRWLKAREAFLALPAGSPEARSRLNDLSEAEDLLATTVRAPDIELHTFGGQCPIQAEGLVDGKPFYFRARGQRWTMSIGGADIILNPEWHYAEPYGDDEFAAGWINSVDVKSGREQNQDVIVILSNGFGK